MRTVIEVDVAFDGPLVLEDVDLGCGEPVSLDPFVGVVDREVGFRGEHDDVVAVVGERADRVQRAREGLQVPEDRASVQVRRPLPELVDVLEVGQIHEIAPILRILGDEVRPELSVVELHPSAGEVCNHPIHVEPYPHGGGT